MERRLYIFNPENDLALAYGEEGYTAPPAARQLRRDLQMLPAWWCEPHSTILSQCCQEDSVWLRCMGEDFGISAGCLPVNHLQNHSFSYIPWGWSRDLRRRLLNECVDALQLPTVEHIDRLRELSHRRISQRLHRWVRDRIVCRHKSGLPIPGRAIVLPEIPHEAHSVDEVREYERSHPKCFIKAPWSSSGHGVYRVLEPQSRNFEIWTQGVINRQDSIMCEPALNVVQDFALEYRCTGGKVEFAGYSVFGNDTHSSFSSGIVASASTLRSLLAGKLTSETGSDGADLLDEVRDVVQAFVAAEIAPHYEGYLGVDMMLYDDSGTVRINPCVEVNLRMTMGAVSAIFASRHLAEGAMGQFVVEQGTPDAIRELASRQKAVIIDGKLHEGTLLLTPIYPDSRYFAYISVK